MKINKPSKLLTKKVALVSVSSLLVLVFGYGAYAMNAKTWPFTQSPGTAENQSQATDANSTSESADTPDNSGSATEDTNNPDASPKTPAENEPRPMPPQDKVGVTITSIHKVSDTVKTRTLIETVTSSGSCTLTFKKDGEIVTKTSEIQALPSSSTCKGFSVPSNELSTGVWQVNLTVATGNKTGSDSRTYEVK